MNNNTGNDLIKWGFNKIHEYPTLSFREVKDQLTSNNIEADILTKFSISERQPIFLTLSGVFDYSNLKICELGEKEYWIEALYYILYGVAGAEYLQFLSNSIFEPTYTAPNEFQNDTKKIMVNCAPAQFATIVEILMNKDYLEKRSNGEGTARLLLKIFEFKSHNPSVESLGRKLFKRETQINETDYDDLNKIIHRKYLKGNKD